MCSSWGHLEFAFHVSYLCALYATHIFADLVGLFSQFLVGAIYFNPFEAIIPLPCFVDRDKGGALLDEGMEYLQEVVNVQEF